MKTKTNFLFMVAIFMMAFTSCLQNPKKLTQEAMKKIVEDRNDSLGKCFMAGDAEKLATMYTSAAKLCPDGSNFIHGRDSIRAFWTEDFKTCKTLEMKTQVITIDGDENIIYETGKASSKFLIQDSTYQVTVKYINVWCKQADGNYLLDIDFWNRVKR